MDISFRVLPKVMLGRSQDELTENDSFIVAESSESDGLIAITRNENQKRITLTNEIKKLGVIIDRGQ